MSTAKPTVEILETPDLGDRSYVVHAGGLAVVIDPQRDIDRLLEVVEERGLQITHVLETHLHNDYITGGLALARRLRADYLVPGLADVAFSRTPTRDGDRFHAGDMSFRVLHTPGHTAHHVSYVVAVDDNDRALFSGGSLLYGSVGRTDLVSPDLTEQLTHEQWRSARRMVAEVDPAADLYPTHGFGSFCSAIETTGDAATVGDQRLTNPALRQEEEPFVRDLLAGLDVYPRYYVHMGPANAAGPDGADLSPAPFVDPAEIRRRIEAGEWVIDIRGRAAYAAGHVSGTLSFDADSNIVTYIGWLIPWGTPITLLGETPGQVAHVQRELVRIGIDRPAGQAVGGPGDWAMPEAVRSIPRATFAQLAAAHKANPEVTVLDVRRKSEWQHAHINGAVLLPIHEVPARLDELPDGPLWVHCQSGFRATTAASFLEAAGHDVVLVDDDFDNAKSAGLPIVPAN